MNIGFIKVYESRLALVANDEFLAGIKTNISLGMLDHLGGHYLVGCGRSVESPPYLADTVPLLLGIAGGKEPACHQHELR